MPTRSEPETTASTGADPLAGPADAHREVAQARAVVWGQLAVALQRPGAATHSRLWSDAGRRVLVEAARALGGAEDPGGLEAAARRLAARPAPELDELQLRYDRLFGHTARGPVCAYETEYGTDGLFRQPRELAHISGYYAAFGLRPRREGERADHVACECEFMGFLAQREVCAPHAEALQTARDAARSFLRGHLGRFGTAFATRLSRADPGGVFGGVGDLLVETLRLEAGAFGVSLGPATLDLRPPQPDPAPMACGAGCAETDPPPFAPPGRMP